MGEGVLVATWRQLLQDAWQRPPHKPSQELFCNTASGPDLQKVQLRTEMMLLDHRHGD